MYSKTSDEMWARYTSENKIQGKSVSVTCIAGWNPCLALYKRCLRTTSPAPSNTKPKSSRHFWSKNLEAVSLLQRRRHGPNCMYKRDKETWIKPIMATKRKMVSLCTCTHSTFPPFIYIYEAPATPEVQIQSSSIPAQWHHYLPCRYSTSLNPWLPAVALRHKNRSSPILTTLIWATHICLLLWLAPIRLIPCPTTVLATPIPSPKHKHILTPSTITQHPHLPLRSCVPRLHELWLRSTALPPVLPWCPWCPRHTLPRLLQPCSRLCTHLRLLDETRRKRSTLAWLPRLLCTSNTSSSSSSSSRCTSNSSSSTMGSFSTAISLLLNRRLSITTGTPTRTLWAWRRHMSSSRRCTNARCGSERKRGAWRAANGESSATRPSRRVSTAQSPSGTVWATLLSPCNLCSPKLFINALFILLLSLVIVWL